MVVVESGSMQHSDTTSYVGVIDTGDMVFVKKVSGQNDVVTYLDGEATGYSTYGGYGNVVIYRPNGETERIGLDGEMEAVVPIIHRAVVWIDANTSKCQNLSSGEFDYANCTFDIPSLGRYDTLDTVVLSGYGFDEDLVAINLGTIMNSYVLKGIVPHGGFITKGDHNQQPDQPGYEPVLPEWIVGRAVGELPWFGLIKLKVTGADLNGVPSNSWTGLYASVFLLLFIPLMFDLLQPRMTKWRKDRKKAPKQPPTEGAPAEHVQTDDDAEALPESGQDAPATPDTAEKAEK
jgi:signal peptidase